MKTPPKIEAKIEDEFAASARAWSPEAVYYWDSHLPRYRYFAGLLGDLGARQAFDRVLDIGMGFQTLLLRKLLPESQIDCLGVYHDPRISHEGNSAFLPGDLNKLAHESGPGHLAGGYDLIVFMEVLEHLYTPPDLVLRYLSSLLSAGGVIVVTTPNAAWLKNRLKMLRGRNPFETLRANPSDMGHIREYTAAELEAIFREQISALVEGGADAILVETMSDPSELCVGVRAARAVTDLPVIATYAFQKSAGQFRTMMGTQVAEAITAAFDAGAAIVGANCGTDLSLADYVELAKEIVAAAGGRPTIMQPNAGAPHQINGEIRYDATPEEMAALTHTLRELGISIVGGCCGTSPAHLAAMSKA